MAKAAQFPDSKGVMMIGQDLIERFRYRKAGFRMGVISSTIKK